jgi:ArsR family transcriptional regulator
VHPDAVREMGTRLLDDSTYQELATLFHVLGDPTRARIVHVLLLQEMCTCDLAAVLGVSESGVSQHLRLLRALRLVKYRRQGRIVYYSLDDEHVADLVRIGLVHQGHSGELIPMAAPARATASEEGPANVAHA